MASDESLTRELAEALRRLHDEAGTMETRSGIRRPLERGPMLAPSEGAVLYARETLACYDAREGAEARERGAAPEPVEREPDGWRPVETAPKDGTRVLLWMPGYREPIRIGYRHWQDPLAWRADPDSYPYDVPPTHWMPLPEPLEAPDEPREATG